MNGVRNIRASREWAKLPGGALALAIGGEIRREELENSFTPLVQSGAVVFDENSGASLRPASAEKLAVSFAALRILGPGYRFRTEVVGSGALQGRVWDGDLVLVGYGDPTLTDADIAALSARVSAVAAAHPLYEGLTSPGSWA